MDGCFMCRLEQYEAFIADGLTPDEASALVSALNGDRP